MNTTTTILPDLSPRTIVLWEQGTRTEHQRIKPRPFGVARANMILRLARLLAVGVPYAECLDSVMTLEEEAYVLALLATKPGYYSFISVLHELANDPGKHVVKVTFSDGDHLTTTINGTRPEIELYYLNPCPWGGTDYDDIGKTRRPVSVEFLD